MDEKSEPLRVCQPCVLGKRLLRFAGRFFVVLILTIGVLLLPTPEGLSSEGHRALAAAIFTGSLLALQPVSLPIVGLMVPLGLVALGLTNSTQSFEPFSRPIIFLVLGSLFIAEALRKHGLARRLALMFIVASGGNVKRLLLGIMAIASLLSMWMENTATAAVLIPVALTISREVSDAKNARGLLALLVLGIAYSASLGGMVTIMGSASNAVTVGFLREIRTWTFIDWVSLGLPAFLLVFPLTWWILNLLVPVAIKRLDLDLARQELRKLGSVTPSEQEILVTMTVTIFFWVTGSLLESILNLPPTLLSPAVIAVATVVYLSIRGILNWEDIKGVSWGFLFIIGAGLALGETLSLTGATNWLANLIKPLIIGPPIFLSILFLVLMSALLTNVMNNATVAAVFVPMLISLARTDSFLNPVQLALPVALATTFGYSLPSASGRMALISATGIVERKEMIRCGLILTFISSILLSFLFYTLVLLKWI